MEEKRSGLREECGLEFKLSRPWWSMYGLTARRAFGPIAGEPRSAHVSQSEHAMIDAQPNALAL